MTTREGVSLIALVLIFRLIIEFGGWPAFASVAAASVIVRIGD